MRRLVLARRRARGEDAGIAMIFTIFLILVITVTSVSLVALLLSQVKPTLLAKKQVRTVDAASAGLQAALGQLRNTTTAGVGDLTKLPCSDPTDSGGVNLLVGNPVQSVNVPGDSISGTVQNTSLAADQASYKTYLVYYATDPTSHENDSNTSWWSSHAIGCKAGIVKSVPSYAFIQSFGISAGVAGLTATEGNRTQHAIYQFSTTTGFTVGGRMAEYNTASPNQDLSMCMDAGTNPVANTIPVMQPCQALGYAPQTWQYRNDLSIFYGGNTQLNLCLQMVGGTSTGSGTAKYYTGGTPELEPCAGTGYGTTYSNGYSPATMQLQEWGFNDNGHMSAPIANGDVTESSGGACLQPNTSDENTLAPAGSRVVITSCSSATTGDTAWNPDAQVGAGKALVYYTGAPGQTMPAGVPASSTTNQYVNFAQFGRCLDVTGQNQDADHLIAYPCKQAPDGCKLTWNQLWSFAPNSSYGKASDGNYYGLFKTSVGSGACTAPGTDYCLTAPTSQTTLSGYTAYYIRTTACGSSPTSYQMWDATGQQASYTTSYLLVNKATGLCMAADPSIQPTFGSPSIVATACDGSGVPSGTTDKNPLLLKWNAPPYNPTPGLNDVQEDGGTVNSTGGN